MIYVVVGEESDYDYSVHNNIYATVSYEKASKKVEELQARAEVIKKAKEEYGDWITANKPHLKFLPVESAELKAILKSPSKKLRNFDKNHPSYAVLAKWRDDVAAGNMTRANWINENCNIIAAKYSLTVNDLFSGDDRLEYSIEEVPSEDEEFNVYSG